MKTYPLITFLAAFVAFVFSPLSFEVAGSLLFAAGLGCVIIADYGPTSRPRPARLAPVIPMEQPVAEPTPELELAA